MHQGLAVKKFLKKSQGENIVLLGTVRRRLKAHFAHQREFPTFVAAEGPWSAGTRVI